MTLKKFFTFKNLLFVAMGLLIFLLGFCDARWPNYLLFGLSVLTTIYIILYADKDGSKSLRPLTIPLIMFGLFALFMAISPEVDRNGEFDFKDKVLKFVIGASVFIVYGYVLQKSYGHKALIRSLIIFMCGSLLLTICNIGYTAIKMPECLTTRSVYNIWIGTTQGSTHVTIWILPSAVFSLFLLIRKGVPKGLKIFAAILLVGLTALSVVLENRGYFACFLLALLLSLVALIIVDKENNSRNFILVIVINIIITLIAIFVLMCTVNLFNFFEWGKNIWFLRRFIGIAQYSSRWNIIWEFLNKFLLYPFGGIVIENNPFNYAHNDLMDIWKVGGFIPFFAYVYIVGITFNNLINKNSDNIPKWPLFIIAMWMIIKFSIGLLEPTIYTYNTYFLFTFVFFGYFLATVKPKKRLHWFTF